MKITIDADNNQLIVSEPVNLQEFFEWCTKHLLNWGEYEIVGLKEEYIGAPGSPNTPFYSEPTFVPVTGTTTWDENTDLKSWYTIDPPII
jgi:hypothetical protein